MSDASAKDTTQSISSWPQTPVDVPGDVPERYFGVWSRTLLETPQGRDTQTLVRWMQLGQWHVDLRVPAEAEADAATASLQGFSGITRITAVETASGVQEMCTWQRLVDFQPPTPSVDEGWMVFETPERVLETGIHATYFEVWERLPGSTGRRIALTEPARSDGLPATRLFVSGHFLMRVRPAAPLSRAFEISFGTWRDGLLAIEASTVSELTSSQAPLQIRPIGKGQAEVEMDGVTATWDVLEWADGAIGPGAWLHCQPCLQTRSSRCC